MMLSTLFSIPASYTFVPNKDFALMTAGISAVIFGLTMASAQLWLFPRLRFPSLLLTLLAVSASYLGILMISMVVTLWLSISIGNRTGLFSTATIAVVRSVFAQDYMPAAIGAAFAMMVAISFFVQISQKMGPGVLLNWILGRYYNPRQEERIFMFLDMRDSTTLAEQLGDLKFSALVREFLNDLSGPVLATKGEVSHYIGDEAVLCWKTARGLPGARCLHLFYLMQDVLEERRAFYEREFGFVPSFKAGAHVGSVVATQVGEIKSEIVFHGDVLNTSARIQGLCNGLGDDFLISRELKDRLEAASIFALDSRGAHELKGKAQPVEVFAVSRGR